MLGRTYQKILANDLALFFRAQSSMTNAHEMQFRKENSMTNAREMQFRKEGRQVLMDTVKIVRSKSMEGVKGSWETFLEVVNKHSKPLPKDPSSHSVKVLASFLATVECKEDRQFVESVCQWTARNHSFELLESENELLVTPEEELVRITRAHRRFRQDYIFESYNKGWIDVRRGMPKDVTEPETLIAIDCEMVECHDGTLEVVRVCVIDRNLNTLIDTLVCPSKEVLDYKSDITGVTAEDLVSVTVTQTDVQNQLREILLPGTIVVGHSVHHDLKALKIHHRRLIDTQLIFPLLGRPPQAILGLRDMCKAVLKYDFREESKPHDCLEDARVPMKLVLHRLQHGQCHIQISNNEDETRQSSLLCHKVPAGVTTDDLQSLFPKTIDCQIEDVTNNNSDYSKYRVIFNKKRDSDNAFAGLQGFTGTDNAGHCQKAVFLRAKQKPKTGAKIKIYIRKMYINTKALDVSILEKSTPRKYILKSKTSEIKTEGKVLQHSDESGNDVKQGRMKPFEEVEVPKDFQMVGVNKKEIEKTSIGKAAQHKVGTGQVELSLHKRKAGNLIESLAEIKEEFKTAGYVKGKRSTMGDVKDGAKVLGKAKKRKTEQHVSF